MLLPSNLLTHTTAVPCQHGLQNKNDDTSYTLTSTSALPLGFLKRPPKPKPFLGFFTSTDGVSTEMLASGTC